MWMISGVVIKLVLLLICILSLYGWGKGIFW